MPPLSRPVAASETRSRGLPSRSEKQRNRNRLLTRRNRSRSILPVLSARWRWYIVSSIALSSATRFTSLKSKIRILLLFFFKKEKKELNTHWLPTILLAHTISSTPTSPLLLTSPSDRSASPTSPSHRSPTARHTSLTAASLALSSRSASGPERSSACAARWRARASAFDAARRERASRKEESNAPWSARVCGFGGRGGGGALLRD